MGPESARISGGALGNVTIGGSLIGSNSNNSGGILGASIAGLTIGGSILGSGGANSGRVASSSGFGAVRVTGSIRGGSGANSGQINANGALTSVTVGGSLLGSSGQGSGLIFSEADMGPVVITGDVQGGSFNAFFNPEATGAIVSNGKLASVTINGSLIGGSGPNSGLVNSIRDMGAVSVKGDVRGGGGLFSGTIKTEGTFATTANLTSVKIGGSLIGGTASLNSGTVLAAGDMTTLSITGNIRGGSATGTANLSRSGYVQAIRIGTMTVGGSIIAGTDTTSGTFSENGAVSVTNDIGVATIKGSLIGNATSRVELKARGQAVPTTTVDLAFGSLTVNGRVEHANILAGYDVFGTARNADAQIGPVVVGGDWIASNLVAGAVAGSDGKFGTIDDAKMPGINGSSGFKDVATVSSRITSIVIGGQACGTPGGIDNFGFVAQNIGSFKLKNGVTTFPLIAGNGNDSFLIGLFADLRLREIL